MPFAATRINLEIKYDTNEFIYKIESQTENKFMVTKWERGEKLGVWNLQIHTTIYKIDKEQGPSI